jgi:hypothetical protein
MLFSMLANLAEDRRGLAAEPGADLASALERLKAQGVGKDAALALLEHALVAPVLTAHPTEVRRKSIIDHRNRVAELMQLRDWVRRRRRTASWSTKRSGGKSPCFGRRERFGANGSMSPTRSTRRSPSFATSSCRSFPSCTRDGNAPSASARQAF